MGNQNSTEQLSVLVDKVPGLWSKKQSMGYCTVVVNTETGVQAEECSVSLEGKLTLQQQLEIYQYRSHSNQYLVEVYDVQLEDRQILCQGREHIKVRTQRIVSRISEIPKISQQQALYVLRQALYGYQVIFQNEGSISLSEDMIGLTPEGKVKVWLNQNFSKNLPEKQALIHQNEMVMVDHVIDIVKEHTLNRQFPEIYNRLLQQKQPNTFNEAIQQLEQYLVSTRTTLPDRINIQGTTSKIIAGRINPISNRVMTADVPVRQKEVKRLATAEQISKPMYVKPTESMNAYLNEKRNSNQGITFTYHKPNQTGNVGQQTVQKTTEKQVTQQAPQLPYQQPPAAQPKQTSQYQNYYGYSKPPLAHNRPPLPPQSMPNKQINPNVRSQMQMMQNKPQNVSIRPSGSSTQLNVQGLSQVKKAQPHSTTILDQQKSIVRQQQSQVLQYNRFGQPKVGTAVERTEPSLQSQIERMKEIAQMAGLNKQQPKKSYSIDGQVSFVSPATESKHIKFEKATILEGEKIYIKAQRQTNPYQLQTKELIREVPLPTIKQVVPVRQRAEQTVSQNVIKPQTMEKGKTFVQNATAKAVNRYSLNQIKPQPITEQPAPSVRSPAVVQSPPATSSQKPQTTTSISNEVEELDNLQKMLNEAVAKTKAINSNKQSMPASLMIRRPADL